MFYLRYALSYLELKGPTFKLKVNFPSSDSVVQIGISGDEPSCSIARYWASKWKIFTVRNKCPRSADAMAFHCIMFEF
jgi:hypothetical protein